MFGSTLIVCAHPDDEVLGAGGTIAKIAASGHSVRAVFLADGVTSRKNGVSEHEQALKIRRAAVAKAAAVLGIEEVSIHDFADNRLDAVDLLDIVKIVEAAIAKYQPQTILTHSLSDLNIDHRRVCEAVATACRPQKGSSVRSVWSFEVPSSTEWSFAGLGPAFQPNCFVDISDQLEKKLQALRVYEAELRPWPHPRSLDGVVHLARWRGATVGVEAAEAFTLQRVLL